ncbi:hypothetical protein L917_02803 [Phytophthora nicotianae]|uniref:Uncharacterized protein n=1 Tax=Phytophthora nicotianae TaxID=4792 RepID=W2LUV4_PHYNI|nr:hypothetical protein L917_02803 [Phytophthora nicotianae]
MAAKSEAAATSNVVEMAPSHASAPASPLRTEFTMTVASIISPSKGENNIRKRRKREPIKLPPWPLIYVSARSSSSSPCKINSSTTNRCELLETVVSGCTTCGSLSTVQFDDTELLSMKLEMDDELDGDDATILTALYSTTCWQDLLIYMKNYPTLTLAFSALSL